MDALRKSLEAEKYSWKAVLQEYALCLINWQRRYYHKEQGILSRSSEVQRGEEEDQLTRSEHTACKKLEIDSHATDEDICEN